jgi:glycosyltransferase involved in cell wall biosynthesis
MNGSTPGMPRRIAHILPWPSVGGTELATLRLARAVESSEFTSVAFCLSNGGPVRELFAQECIPVVTYEAPEPSYRHPRQYLRTSLALARALRRARIELVHFADVVGAHRGSLGAVLAALPAITHVRSSFPQTPSLRDRSFVLPIRRFVFVSAESRETFGYPVRPGRAALLYDGIDPVLPDAEANRTVRQELSIAADAPVIGMVARVAPQKDYPTLIRAAASLVKTHPAVRFLVVGQHSGVETYAEHFRMVRGLINEMGLGAHFIFTDHRSDVERLIAAMDICVLSTHQEGLPLVILEAMAQSKPFVGTSVGGIPEIVRHGETGLLVPPGDAPALAEALIRLLDDQALAARLGQGGRRMVEGEFSLASFAARGRALYRSLLSPEGTE